MSHSGDGNDKVAIRGWCPNAWRPMAAGDGLLVRVRPPLGRLTRDQVAGLCAAASRFGNGWLDLTRRANIQIRGVDAAGWPRLLDRLRTLGLAAADPDREAAHSLLVAPDWRAGDDSHHIAAALLGRLGELPPLPGKVGFVIDAGPVPRLVGEPGDFRIERACGGGLLLRAAGRPTGVPVDRDGVVDALVALSHWFVASGGGQAGRMVRHAAPLPGWARGRAETAPQGPPMTAGTWTMGMAYSAAFGRVRAQALAHLVAASGLDAVRLTPWRLLLAEGGHPIFDLGDLSPDPDAPLHRVDACPGMPDCPQASVETRQIARRLAGHVRGRLHVSGCAKGCARGAPADVTVTGSAGLYAIALNACAGAPPLRAGLDTLQLLAHFGAA